ncbi:maleylpyruvate isomerase N-terminal domain-containing protein [Kineosporia sp. J2-2]|uniref:Maleylpyruvate isomerase N-terminal domain-containing protein n=1 Tax=Kineosporia corallincola TaxID=2835133 RepID=A0ABS5TRE5_9ACTN|nr:maleylpyruvate isomerase N-terminal domain-containing protein [Kineosporia corallincola]MBT0773367.1 maleylpyruvate isomerase N-terminal domain-containing protein [Kineosporia corallincola]
MLSNAEVPVDDGVPVDDVVRVFGQETRAMAAALAALPVRGWDAPTRCDPWTVRELVGHVVTVIGRVPGMVAAPGAVTADTTAVTYYRADERFSPRANQERVRTASARASVPGAGNGELERVSAEVVRACAAQPAGRVVLTRHGDAMLLSEFMVTRVFEVAVHGLDVADAVGRPAWLTGAASGVVLGLLFDDPAAAVALGWAPDELVRRATGRAPLTRAGREHLAGCGLRGLALG